MKLFYAQKSPFVRKALVVANEIGIAESLEKIDCSTTTPVDPDRSNPNPLKKLPAIELDDGTFLFDSPVVCEYLDAEFGDGEIFPARLRRNGLLCGYRRSLTACWTRPCC